MAESLLPFPAKLEPARLYYRNPPGKGVSETDGVELRGRMSAKLRAVAVSGDFHRQSFLQAAEVRGARLCCREQRPSTGQLFDFIPFLYSTAVQGKNS